MLNLYLARHGATDDNDARRYLGRRDPSLGPNGWGQARSLAESLREIPLQRIIASPLLRARQTAAIIAEGRPLTVEIDPAWLELDFGHWDGLTFAEVSERFPDEQRQWLASPELVAPGQGEKLVTLRERVLAAYLALSCELNHDSLLIVTHGGAIRALLSDLTGSSVWDWDVPCGGCYHLCIESDRLLCLSMLNGDESQ